MDGEDQTKSGSQRKTQGRVFTPRDKREGILEEFERSGLRGAEFARRRGLSYGTFVAWVRQRRLERAKVKGPPGARVGSGRTRLALLEAFVAKPPAPEAQGLKLVLSCGTSLVIAEGVQVALAAELLKALRQPC